MDVRPDRATFFKRYNRHRLAALRGGGMIGVLLVVLIFGGATAGAVVTTAQGTTLPELKPVPRVSESHVVRHHGWGGFYLGTRRTRGHFGGGRSVH